MFSVCLLVAPDVQAVSTHGTASPTNFVCEISVLCLCAKFFALCDTHKVKNYFPNSVEYQRHCAHKIGTQYTYVKKRFAFRSRKHCKDNAFFLHTTLLHKKMQLFLKKMIFAIFYLIYTRVHYYVLM